MPKKIDTLKQNVKELDLQSKIDSLKLELKEKDKEIDRMRKDYKTYFEIVNNPFRLLKEFVPDIDFDMDVEGKFDLNTLTKEELANHLQVCHGIYNALPFNREISAMVSGLQTFALTLPETSVEGFKTARQGLAIFRGMIKRFGDLSTMYESRKTQKNKKTPDHSGK